MSRSPFLEPGRRDQRRLRRLHRRRRATAVAAIVAVAAAAAAIAALHRGHKHGQAPGPHTAGTRPGVPEAARPPGYPATNAAPLHLSLAAVPEALTIHFRHEPSAGLLFDLDSGRVLWRREPTQPLPIASLTKMMTALVVVEHAKPAEPVMITKQALAYQGSGVGVLPLGKRVPLETLMYGLLLPSGNDAAIALAQHVAGNVPAFVSMMNERAARLGLKCTHFASPDGVDDGNRSCAADLAVLARADLDQPRIARIVGSRAAVLPFPIKGGKLFLYNNNPLLRVPFPGITGLKTGETIRAGICLVDTATRGKVRLGAIVLHSTPLDAAKQVRALLTAGFNLEAAGR